VSGFTVTPGVLEVIRVEHEGQDVGRLVRVEDDGDTLLVRGDDGRCRRWASSYVEPRRRPLPVFVVWCPGGHVCATFDTAHEADTACEVFDEYGHALPDEHGLS
jgi:hypothetical protein